MALGDLGDNDIALPYLTVDDFVDLVHVASSSNILNHHVFEHDMSIKL